MIDLTLLKEAQKPCVLVSFGKDSLVLLKHVMEVRPDTQILHFYDHLDPFAEKIIREWDLTVGSYAPACRYQVDNTVISEYSFGEMRLPLLQDISESGKPVSTVTTPQFNYDYDLTLWGYRRTDNHPLVNTTFEREFQFGPTKMVAPLYDLSDAEVFAAIDRMGIPYEKTNDDAAPCNLPNVTRETFRERFSF